MTRDVSRRQFIDLVGKYGGAGAAYSSMLAMGLLPLPETYAGPPQLSPGSGRGTKVLILGAGIAGMVAAYELARAGYDCTLLEARSRAGGRNWSLRQGSIVEEIGFAPQTVNWDAADHMYFNPGPARIPHHHQGILSYCRELEVPIELMCNDNRGAYLHDDTAFEGKPQPARSAINDARGFVAELAAKAAAADLLDQPVSIVDKKRILDFLTAFGDLDAHLVYRGSERSGYGSPPSAGDESGTIRNPIDIWQLLASDFWQKPTYKMFFGESFDQAATMLQPAGGMGRIGEAFAKRLAAMSNIRVIYGAEVIEIEKTWDNDGPSGARVFLKGTNPGAAAPLPIAAPYLICTIPLTVLRTIKSNFSDEVTAAIASVPYESAGKIAFQAERRFWELDQQIYGGISWTSRDITQIWYPSAGLHQAKGILMGGYIWDKPRGDAFAQKTPDQRARDAIADGEHIHANYAAQIVKGVSVAWPNVSFTRGAWAIWDSSARNRYYPILLKGDHDRRILFAGEHMSYLSGWQEGAVRSAHYAIAQIARR
jgi:monoamine oxidase